MSDFEKRLNSESQKRFGNDLPGIVEINAYKRGARWGYEQGEADVMHDALELVEALRCYAMLPDNITLPIFTNSTLDRPLNMIAKPALEKWNKKCGGR